MDGKTKQNVKIRPYKVDDARALADIYFNTIHTINIQDYTQKQIDVWAPVSSLELEGWKKKWEQILPLVAVVGDCVVGFTEFENNGHIDCFYCHHGWIRKGVGRSMMKAIEIQGYNKGILRIYAEVSIIAKPFFEHCGFQVVKQQIMERKNIKLINFLMEKFLQVAP